MAVNLSVKITQGVSALILLGLYFLDFILAYFWVFQSGAWFNLSQKAKDILKVVMSVGLVSFVPVLNIIIVPSLFIYYYTNKSAWEPAVGEIVAATSSTKTISLLAVVILKSLIIQIAYGKFISSKNKGKKTAGPKSTTDVVAGGATGAEGGGGAVTKVGSRNRKDLYRSRRSTENPKS